MARELRSRKVVTETKDGQTKAKTVEKTEVKGKRKATAAESDSPIPRKLQKATKKAIAKEGDESPQVAKTTKTKKAAPEPVAEPDLVASDSESEGEEDEDVAQVLAAEIDSGDEEAPDADAVYKPGQPVGKIPDAADAAAKANKKSSKNDEEPGVIYLGRIPHGFYEHEMRQYFSQFGKINKLRLSRNKKTGASKHVAFVEFAEGSTADIVAKTMNNYLLFGHILKCQVIPKDKVHPDLFKGANRRFKKIPWNKISGQQLEKPRSVAVWESNVSREEERRAEKAAKLKALGYEFESPKIKDVPPPTDIPEEIETETKVIEGPNEVEVKETTVTETPTETKVEIKSISAPKAKKGGKNGKSRKAKA